METSEFQSDVRTETRISQLNSEARSDLQDFSQALTTHTVRTLRQNLTGTTVRKATGVETSFMICRTNKGMIV